VQGVGLDSFMKTAAHPNPVKITLATFAHWVSSQPKMRKKKTQVQAVPIGPWLAQALKNARLVPLVDFTMF
jgi:hypothetical protein